MALRFFLSINMIVSDLFLKLNWQCEVSRRDWLSRYVGRSTESRNEYTPLYLHFEYKFTRHKLYLEELPLQYHAHNLACRVTVNCRDVDIFIVKDLQPLPKGKDNNYLTV